MKKRTNKYFFILFHRWCQKQQIIKFYKIPSSVFVNYNINTCELRIVNEIFITNKIIIISKYRLPTKVDSPYNIKYYNIVYEIRTIKIKTEFCRYFILWRKYYLKIFFISFNVPCTAAKTKSTKRLKISLKEKDECNERKI